MLLIIWFLALVAAGDVLSYLVGLFVEYEWGSHLSLIVFLAMYFVTLLGSLASCRKADNAQTDLWQHRSGRLIDSVSLFLTCSRFG